MSTGIAANGSVVSTRRRDRAMWTPAVRARILGWVLIVVAIVLVVGPFLWILMNSFKTQIAILSGAWIFTPTLESYEDVLFSRRSDFLNGLYASLIVATASTAIVLVIGTLAAYSLYRFRWAHWIVAGLLGWMLAFHVIPVITMVGPWYLMFKQLGLYDTRTALILTHVAINLPMAVWLMMSFFKQLPPEIEEAALVDGCRPLSAFWLVTLPLVVPGLIATGVLSFIFSWNEFTVALNLTSQSNATVPVVVAKFANDYEVQHSQMAAASILATLPALLLMFFGQRFIVQGLTQGSVK
jgi:multiple sugar transport system permease protein